MTPGRRPHPAHHAVRLAVRIPRAVDHAEHAVRMPALVPPPHDAAVLRRKAWWTAGRRCSRRRGCAPSRTSRAGRSARSRLSDGDAHGVRSGRARARGSGRRTRCRSGRSRARQATRSCLAATLSSHRARRPWPASWLKRNAGWGRGCCRARRCPRRAACRRRPARPRAGRRTTLGARTARARCGARRSVLRAGEDAPRWEPSISQWAWSSAKSRQKVPSAFQRCHHISMIPRSAPENRA